MAAEARSRTVSIYAANRLFVNAVEWSSGKVSIEGQDLSGEDEYEYVMTVPAESVPALKQALAGAATDDVLELLVAHGETLVCHGERSWLQGHDIPHDFHTY